MSQYTITGFDASAHTAEETQQRVADGGDGHVDVGRRLGRLRLDPASRRHVRGSGHARRRSSTVNNFVPIVPLIWTESMSQNWSEFLLFICVVAQFFCVTASTTSASRMMFAFSRDRAVPGHPLWRRVARNRVPRWSVLGVAFFAAILMLPAIWNYFIGYAVGTAIVGDRSLHRVHHPDVPPLADSVTAGTSRARGASATTTSGSRHSRSSGSALITVPVLDAAVQRRYPVERPDFTWEFTNYTVICGSRRSGSSSAAGGSLSATKWFKGPVRMGTEEELERLEEEQLGEFALPTEAS